MKGPIQSVEVTYLVHATEDPEKLERAVFGLLQIPSEPVLEELQGHFGNPIFRARAHLTGDEATNAFGNLVRAMSAGLRGEIVTSISKHLDEHGSLFLRLDKQKLVTGTVDLASGDAVRVKVKPRLFMVKGGAPRFYAQIIEKA
jgi:RNA binding exosome subunit